MHVVECDSDVILVSTITSTPKRRIFHAGGKSAVLRKLVLKVTDSIGLIDQDPDRVQPRKFLQKFRETEYSETNGLKILLHRQRNNRLVVLCPRLEEWIIRAARNANIRLSRYNLPGHPEHLHEVINLRQNRFQELVEDLMESSDRIRTLRARLRE